VRERQLHLAAWFPYALLDQLRARLMVAAELEALTAQQGGIGGGSAGAVELLGVLGGALGAHLELVAGDAGRVLGSRGMAY
jgi:hypothetical protein